MRRQPAGPRRPHGGRELSRPQCRTHVRQMVRRLHRAIPALRLRGLASSQPSAAPAYHPAAPGQRHSAAPACRRRGPSSRQSVKSRSGEGREPDAPPRVHAADPRRILSATRAAHHTRPAPHAPRTSSSPGCRPRPPLMCKRTAACAARHPVSPNPPAQFPPPARRGGT
jgi:hypothetical protein